MVLFIAEHSKGQLKKSALELATAAQSLAEKLATETVGLVLGTDLESIGQELAKYVSKVLLAEDHSLQEVRAEPYTSVISHIAQDIGAKAILLSASRSGLSISPRVAVRLDTPLLEDVTDLQVDGQHVIATRYSYLSRVTETVKALSLPVVISVKPNIFPVASANLSGSFEKASPKLREEDQRVQVGAKSQASTGRVALEEADIVITGGRGVGGPEGFDALVEPLADLLGAGIGSTRAVVDAGWRPYSEQVGQTGKTVAPNIYFALGVSGAVQHLSGMNRSKIIIAINKDADAPIFKVADYGIIGDVNDIVPALKVALENS